MKRRGLLLAAVLFMVIPLFSQNVFIQDPLFKDALINLGVDTNEDGEISHLEAEAVSALDLSLGGVGQLGIRSLQGLEAFINLDSFSCAYNQVSYLDFSKNTKLTYIDCSFNYPTIYIDVSKNLHLKYLNCSLSGIDNLDVSNNRELEYLYCAENGFTSLDVSNNPALIELATWFTPLISLDISNNPALTNLICGYNQLSSLDVSNNTLLKTLHCNSNRLVGLDLSNNPWIRNLNIGEMNALRQVCVWEHFHSDPINIQASGSPNVYFTTECTFNKIVNIPDANFLNGLIESGADIDGNGLISHAEAEQVTELNVKGRQISDLTGIEAFINLKHLNCADNQIRRLDLSRISFDAATIDCSNNLLTLLILSNSSLQKFYSLNCSNNQLSTLTLSNISIEFSGSLDCSNNLLTSLVLNNVRFNEADLNCSNNRLSNLDVSNASFAYGSLYCTNNLLTSIEFPDNQSLNHLNCSYNKLSDLDLSDIYYVSNVDCSNNQLSKLVFSENSSPGFLNCSNNQLSGIPLQENLVVLNCSFNQFSHLDISKCPNLYALDCSGNPLSSLDLSTNYNLFNYLYLSQEGHLKLAKMPSLSQVCLWEQAFQPADMIGQLDITGSPNVYFTTECTSRIISIPDSAFLSALIEEGVDTNGDKMISYGEADAVTALDVGIHDGDDRKGIILNLSGIEAFQKLDTLDISCHQIQSLMLWNQPKLKYLAATGCRLEFIDVRFCNELRTLDLTYFSAGDPGGRGSLNEIDVSRNRYLTKLTCNNNQISQLDLSNNTELEYLSCSGNLLGSLNVSKNTLLSTLNCNNNRLKSIDVSKNPDLEYLSCGGNNLTSIDVSGNPNLGKLNCSDNRLTGLDLSNNTNLESLYCNTNYLSSLDVSNNTLIKYLGISYNPDLTEVCVWTSPFPPPDVAIDTAGSPKVEFYDCNSTGLEVNNESSLLIYPNPMRDFCRIQVSGPTPLEKIELYDLSGRLVFAKNRIGASSIELQKGNLENGIYILKVHADKIYERKLMIR